MHLRCLGALLLLPLGDRGYRLNDPFPLDPGGDVSAVEVSADGAWIVYVADAEADDVENLWSVPADGSAAPRRLTDFTAVSGGVAGVTLSPDGARVLYSTTLQLPRPLFSVPVDGSAPGVELVGPHVIDFQVTPDSSRVVFIGDIYTDDRFILCSLPVDGSAGPVVLNGPLPAGGDVEEFAIAPDGTRVVHRAAGNLFSSPVDSAGGALQLNPALAAGGAVAGFRISADGSRVVYRADQKTNELFELFSVPVDGSAPAVQLNANLTGTQDVEADFVLAPDGSRAVYRADQTTGDVVELFSVPVDASAPSIRLNPAPVAGGDVQEDPAVSADGTRVVYRADQATDEVVELFSVPLDGTAAAVRLNDPLAAGEDVHAEFRIARAGGRVAFQAGPAGAATLFSAPLDGSAAPLALDSDPQFLFTGLALGANGLWAFYVKPDAAGAHLRSVPLDGSAAALALSGGEDLTDFRLVLGGAGALYLADEDVHQVFELFARPASGAVPSFQVNPEFPDNLVSGSVVASVVAGDHAVYIADPGPDDDRGLYSVPISRQRPPVLISATSGPPLHAYEFGPEPTIGAGGTRAVFLARTGGHHGPNLELYSALLDGSSEPLRLDAPQQALGNVAAFRLSPDGSQAIYLADQETDEVFELYRVPVDGSASPVKLNGALVPGGDVLTGYYPITFQSTADGSRVIYVADQDTNNRAELYAADGSNPPVKLSDPMTGGVALDPQLSADGLWVFYRVQTSSLFFELFRAPSDGSSAPLRISGTSLRSPGVFEDGYRVTPDAARVVFRAYEASFGPPNAFTVPADASAPPQRLNSGTSGFWGVTELELVPAGTLAVFRNDAGGAKLYRVPVDGSGPDVALTPVSGVAAGWEISPDGARVVYAVGTVLRSVPIGGGPPVLLGRNPYFFEIDPTSRRVAFIDPQTYGLSVVPIDGSSSPLQLSTTSSGIPAFTADGSTVLFRLNARQSSYDLHAALLEKAPRSAGDPGTTVTR